METRKELTVQTTLDFVIKMAEGNPGAASVLASLLKVDNGLLVILGLDDMNIRGSQIWIGYKDYCNGDTEKFIECITKRDKGMVEAINKAGLAGNHIHKAVMSGACGNRELLKQELKQEQQKTRLIRLVEVER